MDSRHRAGDGRWLTDAEWMDRTSTNSRYAGVKREGWFVNGGQRLRSAQEPCAVVSRPNDYVPFQSIFDHSGRHAYDPRAQRYPRTASEMRDSGVHPLSYDERQRRYAETRPSLENYPPGHTWEFGGKRPGWFGSSDDGPYGADATRMRRQPDGYRPFQSIRQPDGRHAYDPAAQQYPRYDLPQQIPGGRQSSLITTPVRWPRDTIMEMEMRQGGVRGRRAPAPLPPLPPWR